MRSPHWLALRPAAAPAQAGPGQPSPQQQLAWWALQFTPRVCLLEEAVLLEVSSCLRLFGGLRSLHERIQREGRALALLPEGSPGMAWAPNALAALALLRGGRLNGLTRPLPPLLDALPLPCLSAVEAQSAMLARLGCRRLGDVRRLPRAGLARRFGAALLLALDQAYGELQQAQEWVRLPERFEARLELPWRLEDAPALMPHAESLLRSCCAWLSGHHAGLCALRLGWQHDAMRARDCPPGGELTLRSAELTRSFEHLQGLLREHLAQLVLPAPVAELQLWVDRIEPLHPPNSTLRLDEQARAPAREPLSLLLQRCAVRLGPAQVCQNRPQADARPEAMQAWIPWGADTAAADFPGKGASTGTRPSSGTMATIGRATSTVPAARPGEATASGRAAISGVATASDQAAASNGAARSDGTTAFDKTAVSGETSVADRMTTSAGTASSGKAAIPVEATASGGAAGTGGAAAPVKAAASGRPAASGHATALGSPAAAWPGPQPSWLLEPPLRLPSPRERPFYQGELQLLLGPQRVEGGWWGWPGRPLLQEAGHHAPQVQRDYYLARNPQGQLLWIFRARGGLALVSGPSDPEAGGPAPDDAAPAMHWYLHGLFA